MEIGNSRVNVQNRCVYCNRFIDRKTLDHVPPKCLFPKGTQGLITVPSCQECNNGSAKDDEYFRQMITFAIESSEHHQAKEPTAKALGNLYREESKGFRRMFFETLSQRPVEYKPGLFAPGMEYPTDLHRIGSVVTRTVRGLLWSETRVSLTENYGIIVVPSYNFDFLGPRQMAIIAEVEASEISSQHDRRSIGEGVFDYWWEQRSSEQRPDSAWVLRFYEGIYFVCFIMQKSEAAQAFCRNNWEKGIIAVSDIEIFSPTLET